MLDIVSYSNSPASFDVTPLLTKLEHLEERTSSVLHSDSGGGGSGVGGGASTSNIVRGGDDGENVIQRVKLIELEPYYHHRQQQQQSKKDEGDIDDDEFARIQAKLMKKKESKQRQK